MVLVWRRNATAFTSAIHSCCRPRGIFFIRLKAPLSASVEIFANVRPTSLHWFQLRIMDQSSHRTIDRRWVIA